MFWTGFSVGVIITAFVTFVLFVGYALRECEKEMLDMDENDRDNFKGQEWD